MGHLVFRTQAGAEHGFGHLARSLRSADSINIEAEGSHFITFVCDGTSNLLKKYRPEFVSRWIFVPSDISPKKEQVIFCRVRPINVIIVDRLDSTDNQWKIWREAADKTVHFSDLHETNSLADIFICPQHHNNKTSTDINRAKKIFSGPKYFVLDKAVREFSASHSIKKSVEKIIISLGGWWQPAVAPKIIELIRLIQKYYKFQIEWILGNGVSNQEIDRIRGCVPGAKVMGYVHDFIKRLSTSDIAVIAGGFVKYDTMALGIPSIVLSIVPHQEKLTIPFHASGALIYAGDISDIDVNELFRTVSKLIKNFKERNMLSNRSRSIVDGMGHKRISKIVLDLLNQK